MSFIQLKYLYVVLFLIFIVAIILLYVNISSNALSFNNVHTISIEDFFSFFEGKENSSFIFYTPRSELTLTFQGFDVSPTNLNNESFTIKKSPLSLIFKTLLSNNLAAEIQNDQVYALNTVNDTQNIFFFLTTQVSGPTNNIGYLYFDTVKRS